MVLHIRLSHFRGDKECIIKYILSSSIAEDLSNGDILVDGTPINKLNERLVNLDGTL